MADKDLKQGLFELELHGFTLLEAVLSRAEVAEFRSANARLLAAQGEDLEFHGRAGHIANLPALDPVYFPCIDHPRVLPLLEAVVGVDLILASLNSRVIRPGEGAQALHADVPAQLRKPHPPVMMNSIWLLDDFTAENGGTFIVPGSHLSPLSLPPEDLTIPFVHQLVAPAGSVLVFNGQCWHGGGANRTDRERHALFGHYRVAPWMRFQCDPHRGFRDEWWETLNDRQKRLLRMHKGLGHPHSSDWDEV